MKRLLAILPVALLSLNSCGTIEQMTCLIDESSEAICRNREAVEYSTQVIQENAKVIGASTETVKENFQQLQKAKD